VPVVLLFLSSDFELNHCFGRLETTRSSHSALFLSVGYHRIPFSLIHIFLRSRRHFYHLWSASAVQDGRDYSRIIDDLIHRGVSRKLYEEVIDQFYRTVVKLNQRFDHSIGSGRTTKEKLILELNG